MTEKEKLTDMQKKMTSIIMWFLLVVGIGTPVVVFLVYGLSLGPVSSQTTDWGSFGSVMAGSFTLLGSFATIWTLLFLYSQQAKTEQRQRLIDEENKTNQKKHDEVVKKQIASLVFEQYIKHQTVFLEGLQNIEREFKSKINFSNPEKLYREIFPDNKPSYCSYISGADGSESEKLGFIYDIKEKCESIQYYLGFHPENTNIYGLLCGFFELQEKISITYIEESQEGDVLYAYQKTGFNIYGVHDYISDMQKAVNFIMFFSGNNEIFFNPRFTMLLGGSIYRKILDGEKDIKIFEIYNEISELPRLYDAFGFVCKNCIVLSKSYNKLKFLFLSKNMVLKLKSKDFLSEVLEEIQEDIYANEELLKDKDELEITKNILLGLSQ